MIANIAQYFKLAWRGRKKKGKLDQKNALNLFLKDDLEGIVKTFLFFVVGTQVTLVTWLI